MAITITPRISNKLKLNAEGVPVDSECELPSSGTVGNGEVENAVCAGLRGEQEPPINSKTATNINNLDLLALMNSSLY